MTYVVAMIVLQFHLVRHALTQGKLIAYFLVGFLVVGAMASAGVIGAILFYLVTHWLQGQAPEVVLVAFNGLALIYGLGWFWGLVMEVQRSDIIDIRKMIHFPVPMALVNAINFLVSMVGFTSLFYTAGVLGLVFGIYYATGQGLFLGLLAAMVFFFVTSAWAYYLRGLLVVWMEDKRRRRLLLSVLPFFFMMVAFTPMMLSQFMLGHRGDPAELAAWLSAPEHLIWIERSSFLHPGGQLSLALTTVQSGSGPYGLPMALLVALGAVGYYLGYRTTLRYGYGSQVSNVRRVSTTRTIRPPWTARKLPIFHEETTALATALFLNFARHPQVRTMLLAPIGLIVLLAVVNSRSIAFGQGFGMPVVAIMWPFFMFSGIFFNMFGMDQRGFRTLVLLPTPRHRILAAYHLALLPLAGGMGVAFALFGSWYFSLGVETIVVSLLQILQLFLNFCLAGSFISIYAPMAIGRNMLRKQQSRTLIMALLMPLVLAVLVLPTALCLLVAGFADRIGLMNFPVAPVLSLALLAVTVAVYPLILRHAGDLLMLREQRILATLVKSTG